MTSDANFEGKGDFTKSVEPTAQENGQMVNNDLPTAQNEGVATEAATSTPQPEPPVTVTLPNFMARHVQTHEKGEQLRKAIKKVFKEFFRSDAYYSLEDINKLLSYKALELDFDSLVTTAIITQVGPIPNQEIVVPDDIEENPFQFEAYEVYMSNPLLCEDIPKLQEWVGVLQKMSIRQNYVIDAYKKVEAGNDRIIASQEKINGHSEEIIKNLEKQIEILTTDNTRLRKQVPGETAPTQKYALSLDVSIVKPYRGASEAEILTYALDEYRMSRLEMYKDEVGQAELTNAYCSYSDAEVAQDLLNDLRDSAIRLAEHNYEAAKYQGDSAAYLKAAEKEKKDYASDRRDFFDLHSTDEEKEAEVEIEAAFSKPVTNEPE